MITHWEDIAASSMCVLSGQVTIWRWCSTGKHPHPTPIIPYFPRGHPISGLEIRELRNDPRNKLNRPDTYIHTSIHPSIHACMHACMHAYIHTYIPATGRAERLRKICGCGIKSADHYFGQQNESAEVW